MIQPSKSPISSSLNEILTLFAALTLIISVCPVDAKPNILMIMADDQDYRLGSLNSQRIVQDEIVKKGLKLENHFATVSNCCPSRVSLHRGQQAHNTNHTSVRYPGGGYSKWVASGEDQDYLPMWLKKAGYQTEYIGKLFNGLNLATYQPAPKGWDHVDVLLEPYTYQYNNVVMSENGQHPVFYKGYHQTDVLRAKGLARLDYLTSQTQPWYLTIAPVSPHVQEGPPGPPVPLARHGNDFGGIDGQAPRHPNFNPANDTLQQDKVSWLKDLKALDDTEIGFADSHYRSRLQALQGVDEILQDILDLLEQKNALNDTYIIYTTDNGYHIGTHRVPAGKTLPYIEDTNIPFAIRGPAIPSGKVSNIPSTHIDLAPTFLDIAGLPPGEWPSFLDGRSLLSEWKDLGKLGESLSDSGGVDAKEIINIEFWGSGSIETSVDNPYVKKDIENFKNSYKTLRIVGEEEAWLFSSWCDSNATELYDTIGDPWELHNLAHNPTPYQKRLIDRLNALLLVTKSCTQDLCRNPWIALRPANTTAQIKTLADAMDSSHDTYFSSFARVGFAHCIDYQSVENEKPFYPFNAQHDLGMQWRKSTDNYEVPTVKDNKGVPGNDKNEGGPEHRNVTLEIILRSARTLTKEELGTIAK